MFCLGLVLYISIFVRLRSFLFKPPLTLFTPSSEVHKAIHRSTRRVVALKRILMHNEKEGMPVTALREIKILKALMQNHTKSLKGTGTTARDKIGSIKSSGASIGMGMKGGKENVGAGGASIIEILDMVIIPSSSIPPPTSASSPTPSPSIYMVFPYMDHDLAGLLENERVKLNPSQIKLYMKQLLEGTEYMHRVSEHSFSCLFGLLN